MHVVDQVLRGLPIATVTTLAGVAAAQSSDQPLHHEHDAAPLGVPETRNASGTAWQPDSTPMFMWHARAGDWRLRLHVNAFVGLDQATSPRGDVQFLSINWLMGMATHSVGAGDITVRAMLSGEPATMPKDGYPLLLQTGESVNGEPLHDRQHPHDLFMELAALVRQPLSDVFGLELYAAPVGEPAIGPVAFPHRFTSLADPLAPLGHHWLDSTHISFGVITAGIFTNRVKLEGSWFNGREPDEDRWDFDVRGLDSVSVRLSVNPTRNLSAQVSWAHLASPELLEANVSQQRITASAMWNRRFADEISDFAVTAVYGQNNPSLGPTTRAGLVESTLLLIDTHTLFARVEALTKTGHELVLPPALETGKFTIASLSAGYVYDFHQLDELVPGIGVVGVLNVVGDALADVYDTRTPWGGMVFVRIRPPTMTTQAATSATRTPSNHGHAM